MDFSHWGFYSLFCWLVVGAIVGSFLNVVIYRLPRKMSVSKPSRSFCPRCKVTIPIWRNIPVFTWLIQRRCASCRMPIPARYAAVELITALLFALSFYTWGWAPTAATMALFFCVLVSSSAIDAEHKIIPDALSLGGLAAGLLTSVIDPARMGAPVPASALGLSASASVFWFVTIYFLVKLGDKVFGRQRVTMPSSGGRFWLTEDGDTAIFGMADGLEWKWETLFFKLEDKVVVEGRDFVVDGEPVKGTSMVLWPTRVACGGREWDFSEIKSLSGDATHLILPRQPLGLGDVKLIACMGAFLGITGCGAALFIGSLLQAIFSAILHKRVLPFAPALSIGAVAASLMLPWLRATFGLP